MKENNSDGFLFKILLSITCALVAFIIGLTAYFLASGKARAGYGLKKKSQMIEYSENNDAGNEENEKILSLGQIRTSTKRTFAKENDKNSEDRSSTVILTVFCECNSISKEFSEELSEKRRSLVSAFASYFQSFTEKELLSKGEEKVKQEILSEINSLLVLGTISKLYFNDYLFLN